MAETKMYIAKLKESRERVLLILASVVLLLNLVLGFFSGRKAFMPQAPLAVSVPPKRDFCYLSFTQILSKNLSPIFIEDSLFDLVSRDSYAAMRLNGDEKISFIYSGEEFCKVIIKDKVGLRSFDVFVNEDGGFPYYFKIWKIKEHELYENSNKGGV